LCLTSRVYPYFWKFESVSKKESLQCMDFKKIILSIIPILFLVGLSFGQSSLELKKQRERLDREISELQKVLSAKTQEKLLSQREVSALSRQLKLREDKISTINSEL